MKFKHIDLSEYHYEDETEEIEDIVEELNIILHWKILFAKMAFIGQ